MDHAAVIEVLDRDGHCRETFKPARWPVRIGRSPACDLVLADPHLAGEHALLHWAQEDGEGGPRLQLLESRNGGWIDGHRLSAGDSLAWPSAAELQLGKTRLRLRTALDPLPPERELSRAEEPVKRDARPVWALPALLALWLLGAWAKNWIGSDPGGTWVDTVSGVLAPLGGLLIWTALWALATQLFRHWFAFGAHLWRVLVATLVIQLAGLVLPLVAYAFSLPRLMALDALLLSVGGAWLLWWHAGVVWPRVRRRLATGLGAMVVVGLVLTVGRRTEQQYWLGPSYLSALPPPALRVATPQPVEGFVESLQGLEAPLKRQAGKRNDQDGTSGDDE